MRLNRTLICKTSLTQQRADLQPRWDNHGQKKLLSEELTSKIVHMLKSVMGDVQLQSRYSDNGVGGSV